MYVVQDYIFLKYASTRLHANHRPMKHDMNSRSVRLSTKYSNTKNIMSARISIHDI